MKKIKKTSAKKQDMELKKAKAAFNKKILGMNFENFKKSFLESIETIEEMILETVNWNADQRDVFIKFFGKEINKINNHLNIAEENFQTLNKRLHDLEGFTAIMAIKIKEALQRKPMTYEERKSIANIVSIKWDKTDDKTFNKAA
jgi:hypothetical protein